MFLSSLSKRPRRCFVWVVLVGLGGSAAGVPLLRAQRPERPPYYAVQNARIVPVSGPVIEKGTIVVSNGLIQAVGTDVPIPPEAWVIDGTGLTVYPGLIDSLTTLGLPAPARSRPGGDASGPPSSQRPRQAPRGPEDRAATTTWKLAADNLIADDKRIETWRKGGFATAVTSPAEGIFPGQAAIVDLAEGESNDLIVKTPAALRINLRSAGRGQYPGSLMGIIAYVRQLFLDADQYGRAWTLYEENPVGLKRPAYDRTLAPLVDTRKNARPVLLPGSWAKEIRRALALGMEFGLNTVVYGAHQAYELADELAASGVSVLVSLEWPEKDKEADPEEEDPLRVLRLRDRAPSTPAQLHKAGVRFAFYSDGLKSPAEVLKNTRRAIESGLPEEAALRALTLSAAEIFGVSDRLGSIEPGKIANLVCTSGSLFDEKTKVKMVFVDGEKYEYRETPEKDEEEKTKEEPGTRQAFADRSGKAGKGGKR